MKRLVSFEREDGKMVLVNPDYVAMIEPGSKWVPPQMSEDGSVLLQSGFSEVTYDHCVLVLAVPVAYPATEGTGSDAMRITVADTMDVVTSKLLGTDECR